MIGRDQELALAIDLITDGQSAAVVGGHNSGRSTFVHALRDRLEDLEWNVLLVRGVAALREHPLAALHVANLATPSPQGRASSLADAVVALTALAQRPRTVLCVDDWDELDESSRGVIETVRRSTGIGIVLTQLHRRPGRDLPGDFAAHDSSNYLIELKPLRYEELERVISAHLAGPIEAGTMSSVFARSSGTIGLALALVDACRHEDRLVQRANGVWSAAGELWSPALRSLMEAHLVGLDDTERDALHMLALIGLTEIGPVRELISWHTLETLEERGLITLLNSGKDLLVAVTPALLAEFFRHEALAARRLRLIETMTNRLESVDYQRLLQSSIVAALPDPIEHDALFVRVLQERTQTELALSRAEWEHDHNAQTATRYARALIQAEADSEVIETVFETTDASREAAEHQAALAVVRISWLAYHRRNPDAIESYVRQLAPRLGTYGRLLDAIEVRVLSDIRGVPENFAERLTVSDDLPPAVQAALLQSQMMVLVSLGRFTEATGVWTKIERLAERGEAIMPSAFKALADIGLGAHDEALRGMLAGLEQARAVLDFEAAYTFGTGAALCYLIAGNYQPITPLLHTFFATGNPLPLVPSLHLMLSNIAAVLAVRRGNIDLSKRYVQDIEARGLPDGTFPGQSLSWAKAQLQATDGDIDGALHTLWDASEQLWQRGGRFAAALGFLAAVELQPNQARLDGLAERLAEVDGELVPAYQAYLQALIAHDPVQMAVAFERTLSVGLTGVAVGAAQFASAWFRELGDAAQAEEIEAREAKVVQDQQVHTALDTVRFGASAVALTDREREVASLAAAGLSNQEIAAQLVLSVRTVETHMHRIMRKLDVTSRQALKQYVDAS